MFKSEKDTKSATRPSAWATDQASEAPDEPQPCDPWAKKPRLNLLLLGGDAGKGRTGTRTDTVIVASIDTKTGNTTLVSLPRNTGRMPFPADSPLHKYYPNGFTDGDGNNAEYFLNAMYDNVPDSVPKDLLGRDRQPRRRRDEALRRRGDRSGHRLLRRDQPGRASRR